MNPRQKPLANIPKIDSVFERPEVQRFHKKISRNFIIYAIQKETEAVRRAILDSNSPPVDGDLLDCVVDGVKKRLQQAMGYSLQSVVNATGVILHTGLGRAPLSPEAQEQIVAISKGFCNLEFDLESGKRGDRNAHVEEILCFLTGAEAACVVNNNAAAVLLALNTLADGKEAVVSRGQLVEIGGSFRIPDIMQKSGAKMVEVGTTNRTHFSDYTNAVNQRTGLFCVVHTSNYRVQGFTSAVEISELVALAKQKNLPLLYDLGGGALFDLQQLGLPREPVVYENIKTGVDVVTFSGDKALGGPQCGIVVGKKTHIDRIKKNSLMRAMRCDKLIFAALEATLRQLIRSTPLEESSSVMRLLLAEQSVLQKRALTIVKNIEHPGLTINVVATEACMGSGALPLETFASAAICLSFASGSAEKAARFFRTGDNPIVGYLRNEALYFDLRTILPHEDEIIRKAIMTFVSQLPPPEVMA